jgi:hypothetical protein
VFDSGSCQGKQRLTAVIDAATTFTSTTVLNIVFRAVYRSGARRNA